MNEPVSKYFKDAKNNRYIDECGKYTDFKISKTKNSKGIYNLFI